MKNRSFAYAFYTSDIWRNCRAAYVKKQIFCEECLKRGEHTLGEEVHHKVKLTPENINDPSVSLSFDNLVLLCKQCHEKAHGKHRLRADEDGHVEL